ncbi:MAG: hypothetical protein WCS94_17080, partial [Verrucomicrobiota bacterium]
IGVALIGNVTRAQFGNISPGPSLGQSVTPDSIVQVTAEAQGLPQVDPSALPPFGTFWWAMPGGGGAAPMPCPPANPNVPIYQITEGQFLVDQTAGQVLTGSRAAAQQTRSDQVASALEAQATSLVTLISQVLTTAANQSLRTLARTMNIGVPIPGDDSDGGDGGGGFFTNNFSNFAFNREQLWLEITNVSNDFSFYNLHNATNLVYAIWTTTNLLAPFAVETELWPTDRNCQPFSLHNNSRPYLFVRAEDWTGVDSDGDGVPDWWAWEYWGTTNLTNTNLDYSGNGNTFAQDYSNNITPTVFVFTNLEVPNNYVSTSQPVVQLDVAGNPYYIATLIDDDNFSNAVWNTYSGASVAVNLGSVQGWHQVWVGLRGHADDPATAVWQWKRIKLDWTPPALFITNPTNTTVDIPTIQLQGFSPEALSSISYDLTNAAGLVTNQQILVLNQYYDTSTGEYTTNTWQAFDVVLTNGVNTFIFHATDLAGNPTTASYSMTVDYSAKTNAPSVQVTWPQDGEKIANSSVTIRGQVADATVAVTASVVATNGETNTVSGVVERSGRFWLDNLPLTGGTNIVTITASNVMGKAATITLNLVKNDMTLTLDDISDSTELWQPTIDLRGKVSDPTAAIYVNGVEGSNHGDGTWSASNVPVTEGGVAIFDLNAVPAGGGDPANSVNLDKPAMLYLAHDVQNKTGSTHENWSGAEKDGCGPDDRDENADSKYNFHYDHEWNSTNGGSGAKYDRWYWVDGLGNVTSNLTSGIMNWNTTNGVETDTNSDGTTSTFSIGLPQFGNEHCNVNDPKNSVPVVYDDAWDDDTITNSYSETYTRTADTAWHLKTGGRGLPGLSGPQAVFQFTGYAWKISDKRATPPYSGGQIISPQSITINNKVLGSDNMMYQKLPDNIDIDVTPQVPGIDFYTFYIGMSRHTLTSYTLHPALTDAYRGRTQVGVGEEVSVYLDPPLGMAFPENPTWYVSGGGIDATNGSATTFTAASNACSATVTVQVRDVQLAKNFGVVEPSGVDHANVTISDLKHFNTGEAGAGMHLHPYMAPTSVSFYRVQCEEVGEDASDVTGYFANNPPFTVNALSHRGNTTRNGYKKGDAWFQLQESNLWQEGWDNANTRALPDLPWSDGHFSWVIPGKWKIGSGPTNNIANGWDQRFTINSLGTVTVTKFGHTVTRHINEITGTVN